MPEQLSIHNMPESERPRERLMAQGAAALSNAELLAIILRTGSTEENALHLAERILAQYDGLSGLAQAPLVELAALKGLGIAKTTQIAAALEIGRRLMTFNVNNRPTVTRAEDAALLVVDMCNLHQEQVRVILLDSSRQVTAIQTVYIGTLSASVVRVSEIFRDAVIRNSPALILVHNHPFGDPSPSPEDLELTRILVNAGELLDITLIDHIIIGKDSWASLKEMRLVFT